MKYKYLLLGLFCLVLLSGGAYGEICEDTPTSNNNCTMVTPPINCTTYNYTIYDNNQSVNEIGNLSLYGGDIYYFNFSKQEGQFSIVLCDGTYREIYVNGDGEVITGSILALIGVIGILLFVYTKLDDKEHKILRTFLILFVVYLTAVIPRALHVFIQQEFSWDFLAYYLMFLKVFGFYLFFYFIWTIADYYGKTSGIKHWFSQNVGKKGGDK